MRGPTLALCVVLAAAAATAASPASVSTCRYRSWGALPDRHCTPGATNPAVTQATLRQTICTAGWTATVRPPLAVTEPEKIAAISRYGARFGRNLRAYEFDHLVPLELGGSSVPSNLWPEPAATIGGNGSYDKDAVENHVRALVCAGKVTLAAAQRIFERDWRRGRGAG